MVPYTAGLGTAPVIFFNTILILSLVSEAGNSSHHRPWLLLQSHLPPCMSQVAFTVDSVDGGCWPSVHCYDRNTGRFEAFLTDSNLKTWFSYVFWTCPFPTNLISICEST